jgi:hypothetical protein
LACTALFITRFANGILPAIRAGMLLKEKFLLLQLSHVNDRF